MTIRKSIENILEVSKVFHFLSYLVWNCETKNALKKISKCFLKGGVDNWVLMIGHC